MGNYMMGRAKENEIGKDMRDYFLKLARASEEGTTGH
jgi:hypothetical protein